MGKKKKKGNRKKAGKKPAVAQPTVEERRNFLKGSAGWIAGTAVAASGAGGLAWFLNNTTYDFLNKDYQYSKDPGVIRKYPEIAEPRDFWDAIQKGDMKTEHIWRLAKAEIEGRLRADGFNPGDFDVTGTVEIRAIPLEESVAENYRNYVKESEQFLRERVQGITSPTIDWTIVKQGDDFSSRYKGKGFIAAGRYQGLKLKATHKKDKSKVLGCERGAVFDGSWAAPEYNKKTGKLGDWYIFLGGGPSSLQAPFSEIIPLSTASKDNELSASVMLQLMATEAISEGISYVLAEEMVRMHNIPNGHALINAQLEKMVGSDMRYIAVPKSIAWIQKNCVQKAYDLYMENPMKFLEAIGATGDLGASGR